MLIANCAGINLGAMRLHCTIFTTPVAPRSLLCRGWFCGEVALQLLKEFSGGVLTAPRELQHEGIVMPILGRPPRELALRCGIVLHAEWWKRRAYGSPSVHISGAGRLVLNLDALEVVVNRCQREFSGIKFVAIPFDHVIVFGMFRVGERFFQVLETGEAAAVFRRGGVGTVDT